MKVSCYRTFDIDPPGWKMVPARLGARSKNAGWMQMESAERRFWGTESQRGPGADLC